jgi:hypothetical protein
MTMFADLVTKIDRAAQESLGGVDVIYTPEFGETVTVQGIFDERYHFVDEGHAGAEQIAPAVFLRVSDLSTHPENDNPTLTIAGVDYRVRERQPDGLGGIRLLLHRVT